MALNAGVTPSGNFNLQNWKLTLPVDTSGSVSGSASEVLDLSGYQQAPFFYTGGDGVMVFSAPTDGATTSGSRYPRSELREMDGTERAAWTLAGGGTMTATLEVDQVPVRSDGTPGRIIVGQIHGMDEELVRLYWENDSVYFMNDRAVPNDVETRFDLRNQSGDTPDITLDETFSYQIDARGETLKVSVSADGQVYSSETRISQTWNTDQFYFKAGVYLGVNEGSGSGDGQASFYALQVGHSGEPASLPTVADVSAPVEVAFSSVQAMATADETEESPSADQGDGGQLEEQDNQLGDADDEDGASNQDDPDEDEDFDDDEDEGDEDEAEATAFLDGTSGEDVLTGDDASNVLKGRSGDDQISGGGGADLIEGNSGDDHVDGGTGDDVIKGSDGADAFVFDRDHGSDVVLDFRAEDTLVLDSALFDSVENLREALEATDGGYVLPTGEDSRILFKDADGDVFWNAQILFV